MPGQHAVLVLNAGSSSIKFGLFDCSSGAASRLALAGGEVDGIGGTDGIDGAMTFAVDGAAPRTLRRGDGDPYRAALAPVIEWLREAWPNVRLAAVAHRVVHGGRHYFEPTVVDDAVLSELRTLIPLAPLHQPHNIDAIDTMRAACPGVPQVAVFDTGFHRTLPRIEQLLPLPHSWFDEGVRRYGFHGLSYEFLTIALDEAFGELARGRVIAAHLGSGASLCALRGLVSVATTMGFSALDGLMMSTRCGSIDPGVVLHMIDVRGLSHEALGTLLYHHSGLQGVSGLSGDPRVLLAQEDKNERAKEALELYVHRIVRETGALAAVLGGLDMLVFTAGIGEHSAPIRARVCGALALFGIELDDDANRANAHVISRPTSRVKVVVEPTNEAWIAARAAWSLVGGQARLA
ncbi:acetate kinase [Trinickia dabaoshanensis]|uniref:Acetate kinase n=1 Tax=Trinickia dabaoshanensis TaxID=564714 RepID=A0A2N7VC28_9BURK|nr:acetate/propionate family kinase [Trinickia dabaoshanensis]PMS14720.1 acetate kinase [Trinickia dabaoshanensis]